ncbi:MAG TPA: signal peptidase I [Acidimicrobiales bacterium]|nr:signal peptidase I [Acidimicrobiales bacterium]
MTTGLFGLPPQINPIQRATTGARSAMSRWMKAVPRPKVRDLRTIWGTVVPGIALVLFLTVVAGGIFGYRVLAIKSGSMTPTLHVGDLVVSRQIRPTSAKLGEIISFRDPYLDEQLVTHRVIATTIVGGSVHFVTKGDANSASEHWSIPVNGTIGGELIRIPAVGLWIAPLWSPVVWIVALVLVVLRMAIVLLRWIWTEDRLTASGDDPRTRVVSRRKASWSTVG